MILSEIPLPSLKIHLLGRFSIDVNGARVPTCRWTRRKSKVLIKLLALQTQHQLHREQIMDLLWPDQSQKLSSNNLHKTIHAARRALEPKLSAGVGVSLYRCRGSAGSSACAGRVVDRCGGFRLLRVRCAQADERRGL